jgi:hypothetical protein
MRTGCSSKPVKTPNGKEKPEQTTTPEKETKARRFSRKAFIAAAAILIIAVICGFMFLTPASSSSIAGTKNVIFRSKPLAEGLPNSVVFNIDLKNIISDDVLIQQSWDSTGQSG